MDNDYNEDYRLVNIRFESNWLNERVEISSNLKAEWDDRMDNLKKKYYCWIQMLGYEKYVNEPITVYCICDSGLPENTIRVSAKQFSVNALQPCMEICRFKAINEPLPYLDMVTFSLNARLYDKLMQLPKDSERFQFMGSKFGIIELVTPIRIGDDSGKPWYKVIDCAPIETGLINTSITQIYFARDQEGSISSEMDHQKHLADSVDLNLKTKEGIILCCLTNPVSKELIKFPTSKNSPIFSNDDTIYAFANLETLLKLGILNGSYVLVSDKDTTMTLQVFVALHPHGFETGKMYVHPRAKANFPCSKVVKVNKYEFTPTDISVASSVSLARVGSFHHFQKKYENLILHNLKLFLTTKRRILRYNQLIPIAFDSNFSSLYSDETEIDDNAQLNDCIVWFSIENCEIEDFDDFQTRRTDFIIDPSKTKLVTENIVTKDPSQINNDPFTSYFSLRGVFYYDIFVFNYAQKMVSILKTSLNCINKLIPIDTSIILYSATPNLGKSSLVRYAALILGFHLSEIDCRSLSTLSLGTLDSVAKTIGYLRAKVESVLPYTSPSIIYLSHIEAILAKGDPNQDPQLFNISKSMDVEMTKMIKEFAFKFKGTIFICSTNNIDILPTTFISNIKFDIEIPSPSESQRKNIFEWFLTPLVLNKGMPNNLSFQAHHELIYSKISLQSAGLTPLDIKFTVDKAKTNSLNRQGDLQNNGVYKIRMEDLSKAINEVREDFATSIGAPKIPNVTWDDIGGIDIVKGEIMDTIDMPLKYPELFGSGIKKRSGILFYGPPGTGKTLMAKAIATNFSLNFFSVKGPELLNMYIGESEANVRKVFQKARDAKPCVIFFDELDSVAPKRGNQGDSGGVMDRIVSQLLAELDGMSSSGDGVFVIGATNRPDLLDEALLRPGRFDKLLYLGISDTNEKQLNILKALTRKFRLSEDVKLSQIVQKCPFNYTGADFYALCSDAILNAMTRIAGIVDEKVKEYNEDGNTTFSIKYWFDHVATEQDTKVVVETTDFLKALAELIPSVSNQELEHYLKIKANFEG